MFTVVIFAFCLNIYFLWVSAVILDGLVSPSLMTAYNFQGLLLQFVTFTICRLIFMFAIVSPQVAHANTGLPSCLRQ